VTRLPKDSVANVSRIVALDRAVLGDRVTKLSASRSTSSSTASTPCSGVREQGRQPTGTATVAGAAAAGWVIIDRVGRRTRAMSAPP
jgi:hypothetical protein